MTNEISKPSPYRVAAMGNPEHKARKPRRIGHVGQAYLEAVEKATPKRQNAAHAMARMAGKVAA